MATSASRAVATACWNAASAASRVCGGFLGPGMKSSNIEGMSRLISGPLACVTFTLVPTLARMPSRIVTAAGW